MTIERTLHARISLLDCTDADIEADVAQAAAVNTLEQIASPVDTLTFTFTIEAFTGYRTSPNLRMHPARLGAHRAKLRDAAYSKANNAYRALEEAGETFPWERVTVLYTVLSVHEQRMDRDNVIAAAKPVLDGLKARGVVADDGPDHVRGINVAYGYKPPPFRGRSGVDLRVEVIKA